MLATLPQWGIKGSPSEELPSPGSWAAFEQVAEAPGRRAKMERIEEGLGASHHMLSQWLLTQMSFVVEGARNQIYLDWGFETTAQWLSAITGMGLYKACEMVDIATMLEELPEIRAAFADGRLNYDHLRALHRVATPENEEALLEAISGKSVAETFHLAERIAALQESFPDGPRESFLETNWDKTHGCLRVYGELMGEQGAMFKQAIDCLARGIPEDPDPSKQPTSMPEKRAAALFEMARSTSAGSKEPLVLVHVQASQLSSRSQSLTEAKTVLPEGDPAQIQGGGFIPTGVAKRLLCDSLVQLVIDDPHGAPLGYGRRRRTVNRRLRNGLERRDVTCRWPSCPHRHNLEAHHILPWTSGGETNYDNLVLLCHTHHRAIEHGGFRILGRPPNIRIQGPDGRVIQNGPIARRGRVQDLFSAELRSVIGRPGPYGRLTEFDLPGLNDPQGRSP